MSMSIQQLANEVERKAELLDMPIPLTKQDYIDFVIEGLRTFYGDFNRQDQFYNAIKLIQNQDELNLTLNEQRYVLLIARIGIVDKMKSSKAALIGYTTNALSVTNADKPFANLNAMHDELQLERRRLYYRIKGGIHQVFPQPTTLPFC